ncbi:MAG: beta-glucuronidase [Firmicutes bacterium]|nr:beta-glucuronidase [Bacillota bacterium]
MIRLFRTHDVRPMEDWEGLWDFEPMVDDTLPLEYHYRIAVPGVWESHPQFHRYRGLAAYRRPFHTSDKANWRFVFGGVSHTAKVYLDGQFLMKHYNAYTSFAVIAPQLPAGDHELVVVVDNRFTTDSTLHIPNDYYTYGGLIRPVSVERIPASFIESVYWRAHPENEHWRGEITVTLCCLENLDSNIIVEAELANQKVDLRPIDSPEAITKHPRRLVYQGTASFQNVRPWSPSSPTLYFLVLRIKSSATGHVLDDLIERVGFRHIAVDEERVLVNGEPVVLKGVNRHEDYADFGAAVPYPAMVRDIELIKDLGANAIRTSHYPNDERFLDLCDENGLLVWEEHHARGFSWEHMQHPMFESQITSCTEEMVVQHRNHPSIVIWGIFNECASDNLAARSLYSSQIDLIRTLDPSRPVTYATHHRDRDVCLDLVDIASFNLYPGWYTDENPEELFAAAKQWARSGEGTQKKPVIISEMGADGVYGERHPEGVAGTEDRQASILQKDIEAAFKNQVAGFFLWQFADCRVSDEWRSRRPLGYNVKGIVDRYRRPKVAYAVVKKLLETPQ